MADIGGSPEKAARKDPHRKEQKIWLKAKRDIAVKFDYDPDHVSANELQRVEAEFNRHNLIGRNWRKK